MRATTTKESNTNKNSSKAKVVVNSKKMDVRGKKCIQVLNRVLADEYLLFTKTLNFHWNVRGPGFQSIHKFLDDQYHELLEIMDQVAERVRILDGFPLSTALEMRYASGITEDPGSHPKTSVMLSDLLDDHHLIQKKIKRALKEDSEAFEEDPGTEDFLIGILQKHEKTSWMLKSHLKNTN